MLYGMSDVYRKEGRPDRLVDTESERTAAVFEGFKLVKPEEKKAEKQGGQNAGNQTNTRNQS
jgi:hypothetical protein